MFLSLFYLFGQHFLGLEIYILLNKLQIYYLEFRSSDDYERNIGEVCIFRKYIFVCMRIYSQLVINNMYIYEYTYIYLRKLFFLQNILIYLIIEQLLDKYLYPWPP